MTARPVTPTFTASPQIQPEDVASLAEQGFTTLISNRPDDEEPGQPSAASIADKAEQAGLRFVHIPITGPAVADADIQAMASALAADEGKVFGFCRSGTRSTILWALASAEREDPAALIEAARGAGYDISGLAAALTARREVAKRTPTP